MNYFVHDKRDLSPAYVRKCDRFLCSLRDAGLVTKPQANTLFRLQGQRKKSTLAQSRPATAASFRRGGRKLRYTPTGILLGVDLGDKPQAGGPAHKESGHEQPD